jgi:hypothetical protein
MAECEWCLKDMASDEVTTCKEALVEGINLPQVPYDGDVRCHDCNVEPGGFHHPGCDNEDCPKCSGQLISCGCLD